MKFKRFLFLCLFFIFFSGTLPSQENGVFTGTFDFSTTLIDFFQTDIAPSNVNYVLNGLVGEVFRAEQDGQAVIRVELVFSRWVDGLTLETYTGHVYFDGVRFAQLFPERISSRSPDWVIGPKATIRVIATFRGMEDGEPRFIGRFAQKL
jgi:hypothetical protein